MLVCIAKALSYNTRLLILNLTNLALSPDYFNHLSRILLRYQSRDMACLIISKSYNPLASIADTAVILKQGTDIKTIRHQGITQSLIDSYFAPVVPQSHNSSLASEKTQPAQKLLLGSSSQVFAAWTPGKIIGIIDYSPDLTVNFHEYIQKFCCENSAVFTQSTLESPISPDDTSFRWIPENSNFYLLENLSIADNLLFPRYPEISGPCGYLKNSIKSYCEHDFCSLLHLSSLPDSVEKLSTLQKRILSVYRFAYPGIKALFLESPFINLDPAGQMIMYQLFQKLSNEGFAVFIISKEYSRVHQFCTDVIICSHYKWEKTIP